MSKLSFNGPWKRGLNRRKRGKGIRGISNCRVEDKFGTPVAYAYRQKSANGQKNNANLLTQAPDMFQLIYSCCRIEHSFSRCEFRPESCKNCPMDTIIRKVEGEI